MWHWWTGLVPYPQAFEAMQSHVTNMRTEASRPEQIWGMEHEPVYTAGTSAHADELISPRFPVYPTNRGGRYTYHGPGQLVVYPLLDLHKRAWDVRSYVRKLEKWMQAILAECGVKAKPHPERIGLWVDDAKIGAIGVRVTRGISWHGFSMNVCPNLNHFQGIVPCGLHLGVTSLKELGWHGTVEDVWHIAIETSSALTPTPSKLGLYL